MASTLERLTDVFRDVFEDDALTVDHRTTAKDAEGWDSLESLPNSRQTW